MREREKKSAKFLYIPIFFNHFFVVRLLIKSYLLFISRNVSSLKWFIFFLLIFIIEMKFISISFLFITTTTMKNKVFEIY